MQKSSMALVRQCIKVGLINNYEIDITNYDIDFSSSLYETSK
jgi:hypothetical protein